MALASPAAIVLTLKSDRSTVLSFSTSTSKYSSLSSLKFPCHLRIGSNNSSVRFSRLRTPVVAKQQTFSSFDDLLATSDKPVLVDFYATWCGPCQFMTPILNQVSETLNDKVRVVKIDTEKYPAVANKYKIEALPTFIVFKNGEPCDRFEGALTADQLVQRIEASLEVKQ